MKRDLLHIHKVARLSRVISFFVLSTIASALSSHAELVTYEVRWSGSSFGNTASAVAQIVIDTSLVPNPGATQFPAPIQGSFIQSIDMTVTGASQGNGHFTAADFDEGLVWDTFNATLDLTRELVGQPTPDLPWGSGQQEGDFNLFSTTGAPRGTDYYQLTTASSGEGASGDAMHLVSFHPIGSGEAITVPVTVKGDPATGITGAKFASFGNPGLNRNGHVTFAATVTGTNSAATSALQGNTRGIWADGTNGVRQLLARQGDTAPGTAGAVFNSFNDPVNNGNDAVAFVSTLKTGVGDTGTSPVNNNKGIWSTVDGSLKLVARQAMPAPGCGPNEVFKSFSQIALPDQGGVVFYAYLANADGTAVGSGSNSGIWAMNTGGTLQLVIRKGSVHPVTSGTVSSVYFLNPSATVGGQTRSYDQGTGDILYRANFAGGGSGIFKVVFP